MGTTHPRWWLRLLLAVPLCGLAVIVPLLDCRSGGYHAAIIAASALWVVFWPAVGFAGRRVSPAVVALGGWFFGSLAVESLLPPRISRHTVEAEAAPLTRQLDAYRLAHGRFPPTLEAAGIKPPRYRGGVSFDYQLGPDGQCSLRIGDYNCDDFSAWWGSASRKWEVDS